MIVHENIDKALEAIKAISLSKGSNPKYYRGQRKDYTITSSIHRLKTDEETKDEAVKTNAFIQWLKARNALLPSVAATNDTLHGTDLIYWAIAQHYSYKTDLIDFSTSLEIATAFSLLGKQAGDKGVIYCLWDEDIEDISNMYRWTSDSLDPQSRALLESVNYNPFFVFQIDELSRITNQHGLFLWDLNGLISTYWSKSVMNDEEWVDTHCFYFQQTDTSIDVDVLRKVYPEPNYIEILIDQFVQIANKHFFYKNYGQLLGSIETVVPLSTNSLVDHFAENDYTPLRNLFFHDNNIFFPRDGMETISVEIDFSTLAQLEKDEEALQFVKSWLKHLNNNQYDMFISTQPNPILKLYAEIINEVLALKGVFPAFNDEALCIIMQKAISILGSLILLANNSSPKVYENVLIILSEYQFNLNDPGCSIEQVLDKLREHVCLNDLAEDIWGDKCIFLKLIGCNDTTSFGVLPQQFVDDLSSDYRKQQLEKLQQLFEQDSLPATQVAIPQTGEGLYRVSKDKESLTLKDLLNYITVPSVLFDARDMFLATLHCFIPWQIVMCPKRNRLYNPLEYKEIRLMENENIHNAKVYYWGGSYVYLTDKKQP